MKEIDIFRKISLNEALCGYTTVVKHLDGRELAISSTPGEVIQPGIFLWKSKKSIAIFAIFLECIRGVLGEGMPIPNSQEKGNLYILFDVEFPPNHFTDEASLKVWLN